MDYDVIVIGGGPAGLTAATEIAKAGRRVLVLERESFGGRVMNTEWIEDWPSPGERIEGPKLGTQLVDAAQAAGVKLELGEVIEAESYSSTRSVTTADGKAFTASALIVASGLRNKTLGIPGEEAFQGKGVIHCAFCDAGLYRGQDVAVCGGGDAGFTEALLLARYAQKVVLLEQAAAPSAAPALQAAAREATNLEIRTGQTLAAVNGDLAVTSVDVRDVAGGSTAPLAVTGVLVQCGFEPATEAVAAVVDLDDTNAIVTDAQGVTPAKGVLAAGDVRAGASRRVAAAVSDGQRAAAAALALLA